MRGWVRKSRQKRLVYHSLGGGQIMALPGSSDPATTSADIAWALTRPIMSWEFNATNPASTPWRADGKVVGVSVTLIARNTVSVSQGTYYVTDIDDDTNPLGSTTQSGRGWGVYNGKVVNHYDAMSIPFVRTNSSGQFKYSVNWAAGTIAYYCRITGYWTEEPA